MLEGYDRGPLLLFYGFEESTVVRLAGVVETSRRRALVQLELELAAELLAHLRVIESATRAAISTPSSPS